jgi:hypothetical protein
MTLRTLCSVLALSLCLLSGCAGPARLPTVRGGESMLLMVSQAPDADGPVRIVNQDFGNNVSDAATTGAATGGVVGMVCGPLFIVCSPLAAGVGALAGGAGGAVVGVTAALPGDKAAQLRERIARVRQSRRLVDELRKHLTEQARRHWAVDTPPPTRVTVTVELQTLVLNTTRDERIGLVLQVLVDVQTAAGTPTAPAPAAGDRRSSTAKVRKRIDYVGPLIPLALWLDERDDFIHTSLSKGLQQIAAQIVSELAQD